MLLYMASLVITSAAVGFGCSALCTSQLVIRSYDTSVDSSSQPWRKLLLGFNMY